jgi:uncharacterized protein (DUF3820 family)
MFVNDDCIITFGRFKGTRMADIPVWYMRSLFLKNMSMRTYGVMSDVMVYINSNKEKYGV